MSESIKRGVVAVPTAAIVVIFVAATLISLPYQSQVADAAPSKTYQIRVTLTDVPANADDLIMNASIIRQPFFVIVSDIQIKTVSSPSEGEVVRFTLKVPSGSNENNIFVCGTQATSPHINDCELYPLPSTQGGGPIRVDFAYPTS